MARVEEPLNEQMELQLEDNEQLVSIDELSDKPKAAEPVQATAYVEEDKPCIKKLRNLLDGRVMS
jgi:hypothetical protein